MQVKLTDSLKNGSYYSCEYYVNRTEGTQYGCNNIAMLITKTAVKVDIANFPYGVLPANPQIVNYGNPVISDTMNWVKVSGIFKAQGGEQYLTLGNFKYDTQTIFKPFQPSGYYGATYLIDDVSVIPLDSMPLKADAGRDTTISIGDSVFIGSYTNGIDTIQWQILNTVTTIDSLRPGFWVHPLVNTCYVLTQTVNGYTSSDTVCITVKPLPLKFMNYALRQTQGDKVENLWTTANEINVSHFNIQRSINGRDFTTIAKVVTNNKSFNEYSFMDNGQLSTVDRRLYYRIESIDKDGYKDYSEVRQIAMGNGQLAISVYPNPAKDFITIDCKGAKEFKIIDYLGRLVTHKKIINYQLSIINVQDFAKGMYIVQIVTDKGEVLNKKLLVD